jgi:hypothetical protein
MKEGFYLVSSPDLSPVYSERKLGGGWRPYRIWQPVSVPALGAHPVRGVEKLSKQRKEVSEGAERRGER